MTLLKRGERLCTMLVIYLTLSFEQEDSINHLMPPLDGLASELCQQPLFLLTHRINTICQSMMPFLSLGKSQGDTHLLLRLFTKFLLTFMLFSALQFQLKMDLKSTSLIRKTGCVKNTHSLRFTIEKQRPRLHLFCTLLNFPSFKSQLSHFNHTVTLRKNILEYCTSSLMH